MTHYEIQTAWTLHNTHDWTLLDLARIYRVTEAALAKSLLNLDGIKRK